MVRVHTFALLVLAALSLFIFPVSAQVEGRISGSVLDPSGSAVPGAKISLLLPGGASPVLTATTTADGLFRLAGVLPRAYDLVIDAAGFRKSTAKGIKVDPGRETAVPAIRLQLGPVTESVDVSAIVQGVETTTAEVSTTVTNQQVRNLPILDRDPLALITTQPGVVYDANNGETVINGQRSSYSSVTLDGINIQDNFIRTGGLDYTPNLLLLDQVAEFTVNTSNANSSVGGGSSGVAFVTPSGTNEFHGSAYWENRNDAVASGNWFDNQAAIPKAKLNQNQMGGTFGGPVVKDKLFFYTNYEAFRSHQDYSNNTTILTQNARQGIFQYRAKNGTLQTSKDLVSLAGESPNPIMQQILAQVPGPENINNSDLGDGLNFGGYLLHVRNNQLRDNFTGKADYVLSTKNMFSGTFVWNRDVNDRPDLETDYSAVPKVTNRDHANLLSAAWRWNPKPTFTNELRAGFNLAPITFPTSQQFGPYIIDGTIYTNPVNTQRAEGRNTNTYVFLDNASYTRGKHNFQFGFQTQQVRVATSGDGGITPTYSIGQGLDNNGLSSAQLSGIGATDLANANALLASLAGDLYGYTQTFNITSRTSGFVPGAPSKRNYSLNNYSAFVHDNWKIRKRLTLTLGMRWEYYTPVDERNALGLLPVLQNNNIISTLLSNATLDFAGSAVGRPWYAPDRNNFAPNVGLAWDVFGNGKTALRAGYSIHYVNDEIISSILNNVNTNAGLVATSLDYSITATASSKMPPVTLPKYQVPLTFAADHLLDPTNAFGMPDPHLRTPYVQEWSFGLQHQFKKNTVEFRYVGNHAVKALRAFDYNQVIIKQNGFLNDFLAAQNNGFLALKANPGAGFLPAYNAAVPGSQPLPVFNQLGGSGNLRNATVRSYIETGQAGELANFYQTRGTNGTVNFYTNPYALGANTISNFSNSNFNALQVQVRRNVKEGLDISANYTFSKVLSDAAGNDQSRFEAFLDFANTKIERARAPFDLTHAIKANGIYDLPMGKDHRFNYRPLERLLDGWKTSGILTWQSGAPFSIVSGYATLNRASRSTGINTADTSLTKGQLDSLLQFNQTGGGPFFIKPSAVGMDGRGVAPAGSPAFTGQVFSNPGAGTLGTLQRRMFSGPWSFNLDFALIKDIPITERHSFEIRMESTNIFNHPSWYVGDQNVNDTTFGRISATLYEPRRIQFGLHYRF